VVVPPVAIQALFFPLGSYAGSTCREEPSPGSAGALPQETDMGTVYIGYSYIDDDGNEEIYWFPAEEIVDGDTGAVEYVPPSS
jgi:hypothetical protein